jgi:hypothetical protein
LTPTSGWFSTHGRTDCYKPQHAISVAIRHIDRMAPVKAPVWCVDHGRGPLG